MKQRNLRRRPAECEQNLGAADIIADGPAAVGSSCREYSVVDPADELIVGDKLSVRARSAALFLPNWGRPIDVRRGGGELRKIGDDVRPDLVEIVNAGDADVAHIAPEGAFVA